MSHSGDRPRAFVLDEPAIAEAASRLGGALRSLGAREGDAVALWAQSSPRFVAARDAATALGLFFVPLHPRLSPIEVADLVRRSHARILMTDREPDEDLAAPTYSLDRLEEMGRRAGPGPRPRPADIGATLLFTSGTTGRPKACVRTAAQEAARAAELVSTYGITADDVHLVACPLCHSAPGIFLRACRSAGAKTVLLSRFDPQAFLATVEEHRASVFFLVPTQVERLLGLSEEERSVHDISSVRAFIVAGAPFPRATKERLLAWIGEGKLWEFYGSSETGTITVVPPSEQPGPSGCVGRPPAGVKIQIRDELGGCLPRGEQGEIWVKSDAVMQGYLHKDVGSLHSPSPPRRARPDGFPLCEEPTPFDGYVTVGDVGYVDEEGRLILVDRKHDLVITGGVNVYPAEVERAIVEHPQVAAAVCFGRPHPEWGEELCSAVALRNGSPVLESDLRAFLSQRLAPFKIPKRFLFVSRDDLPVGENGKPLRRKARELMG